MSFTATVHFVGGNKGFQGATPQHAADAFDCNDQVAGFVAFRANVHTGVIDAEGYRVTNISGFVDIQRCSRVIAGPFDLERKVVIAD